MNTQTVQTALNHVHRACFGFVPRIAEIPFTTSYKTEPLKAYVPGAPRVKAACVKWTAEDEAHLIRCVQAGMKPKDITMAGRSPQSIKAKVQWLRDMGRLDYVVKGKS